MRVAEARATPGTELKATLVTGARAAAEARVAMASPGEPKTRKIGTRTADPRAIRLLAVHLKELLNATGLAF
jgi:hypothetical protein